MFTIKNFIKKGLLAAVSNLPKYKVILNAVGWLAKHTLTETDLAEINTRIYGSEAKYDLREFTKNGILDAVGKLPTYEVVRIAVEWNEKGVLNEADLAEINEKIEAQEAIEKEE